MKFKEIPKSWYFLFSVIVLYISFNFFNKSLFLDISKYFSSLVMKMIPIFFFVFILMGLSNYFITPKFVIKHLKDSGLKKWFFVVFGGILSSGPIYMWFPFLADLHKKGLSQGMVACFLYNRAIKIPLLPLALSYFSWQFIILILILLILFSIFQALIFDKIIFKEDK